MASENEKFNQIKYQNEYNKKNYDRVTFMIPKGKKDSIKESAKAKGESMSEYIWKAVQGRMNG